MTNKELKEEITRLKTALAELEEKVEVLPDRVGGGGVFKPEDGQDYWYIGGAGEAVRDQCGDVLIDDYRNSIGNCFQTRQSTEDTIRALKLTQKARETQNGFMPDWEDSTQHKYFLYFHMGDIGVADYPSIHVAPIFGFWEDKSACEQFIDENRDELIWFFTEYRR